MLEKLRSVGQGKLAQIILALIMVPFALWGIDSYFHSAGLNTTVAKIGGIWGDKISIQEYELAVREARSNLQYAQQDASWLNQPFAKMEILHRVVNNRLLQKESQELNFRISDNALSTHIMEIPDFMENGKFSQSRYDKLLLQAQQPSVVFENKIREEIRTNQFIDGFWLGLFTPTAITENIFNAEEQERKISASFLKTSDFEAKSVVSKDEVKKRFLQKQQSYYIPEQVKLEFIVFSANDLIKDAKVTDQEIAEFYQVNKNSLSGNESRKARHILIKMLPTDTPQIKESAHQKAIQVLNEIKKTPEKFSELARKYSDDKASGENGGDLGFIERGVMVKPFEDAVFSMQENQVSDLVLSDFGYHIIQLVEIKGKGKSFEQLVPEIKAELLYQKALTQFSTLAESFHDSVYEQSDNLEGAAKKFNLTVQKTDWMNQADIQKYFNKNGAVIAQKIFLAESLKDRRNTEAMELDDKNLLSARVTDYKPKIFKKLEEVFPLIEQQIKQEKALKMAIDAGNLQLKSLRNGVSSKNIKWEEPISITRKSHGDLKGINSLDVAKLFATSQQKLPFYEGFKTEDGFTLIKILEVKNPEKMDEGNLKFIEGKRAEAFKASFLDSLHKKFKVKLYPERIIAHPNREKE